MTETTIRSDTVAAAGRTPAQVAVTYNRHGIESRFLHELARRVLIYDGGMGTQLLERQHRLTDADYLGNTQRGPHEILGTTRPDILEEIHEAYLAAGADVLETDTFQGSLRRLHEWGIADRAYEINFNAVACARRAADRWSTRTHPRFVALALGPTGALPSGDEESLLARTLGHDGTPMYRSLWEELTEGARLQVRAGIDAGADVVIIETQFDILETKAFIAGARRAFHDTGRRLPIQCQVTLDTSGRMLFGTDVAAALAIVEALPVDVIGLNCSTGPDYMREPVRYLCANSRLPVSCIPNAGLPVNVDGQAVYPLGAVPMAEELAEFVRELGVNIVGGCCGSTPEHTRELVARLSGATPRPRSAPDVPRIASALRAVELRQDPGPLVVGERLNAQGSRAVKRHLLARDWEQLVSIGRTQAESGAHALDVCVAVVERTDEDASMAELVRRLRMVVEAPLVIDTTEAEVVQAALEAYPGRPILNSIHAEDRAGRIDRWVPLMIEHGAAAVAMCIDERGQATTAEWKLEAATKVHAIVCGEYGLPPDRLIFDALTFTLTTGQEELANSAVETIEGIRRIKAELPGVLTILGVSNVSFGIPLHLREILNATFLYYAVEAGLDLAIINPAISRPFASIPPEARQLAEDLIFNRHADALPRFLSYGEEAAPSTGQTSGGDAARAPRAGNHAPEHPEARLAWQVLERQKEGVEEVVGQAIARRTATREMTAHEAAVGVLNEVLLPAMKQVGDEFGRGERMLPYVLQSAEVMKRAVSRLEASLDQVEGVRRGTVLLATVYGDVHDIGKSLVNTILSNNGFTVHDLGKQVPVNRIADAAVELGADVIGLSALLVSTSAQMRLATRELARRGMSVPVLVGGAAINREFGARANFVDDALSQLYSGGVFYCKDAFEGLEMATRLVDETARATALDDVRARALDEARRLASLRDEKR
jgi:5-methyltetrahydrofolate--homocysteine methyltransferase